MITGQNDHRFLPFGSLQEPINRLLRQSVDGLQLLSVLLSVLSPLLGRHHPVAPIGHLGPSPTSLAVRVLTKNKGRMRSDDVGEDK